MRKAPISVRFVMDISVVMLWRFEDERNGSAEAISRKREKAYHRGGRSEDIAERVDDGHSVRYEQTRPHVLGIQNGTSSLQSTGDDKAVPVGETVLFAKLRRLMYCDSFGWNHFVFRVEGGDQPLDFGFGQPRFFQQVDASFVDDLRAYNHSRFLNNRLRTGVLQAVLPPYQRIERSVAGMGLVPMHGLEIRYPERLRKKQVNIGLLCSRSLHQQNNAHHIVDLVAVRIRNWNHPVRHSGLEFDGIHRALPLSA